MAGFDLAGSVQAGQGIVSPIVTGIHDLLKKNEQDQTDTAQADALAAAAVGSGDMTPEQHAEYLKAPLEKKKGIVGALTLSFAQKLQKAQADKAAADANLLWAKGNQAWQGGGDNAPATTPYLKTDYDNEGNPVTYLVGGSGQFQIVSGKQKAGSADEGDSWVKLNRDVKNVSGASLGDWQRATDKHLDPQTGEFVAQVPSGPSRVIDGVTYAGKSKTVKIPGPVYQEHLRRFQDLSATMPNAMPIPDLPTPPAQQQPAPNAAAAASATPAAPVRVSTPEEAAALPPGTLFITPDGRTKRRP